jgi:hypothetical protein
MDTGPRRRSRRPLWLVEGVDVAESRARILWGVAGGVCLVGILLTLALPGIVPPSPVLGGAIALASILLGFAVAVAMDAAALVVRGPRHVRAAGGDLVAVLPSEAATVDAVLLARAVLEARPDEERLLLGLAPAGGDSALTAAWGAALGTAVAEEGASVLALDLASGRSESAGLAEALRDGRPLASVAEVDGRLRLARMGAGGDLSAALEGLGDLRERLPRDLDVLLVTLPVPASSQVVAAARDLDHLLLVAERDRTSRVDLIAALDALERVGVAAQVVLIDDWTVARLAQPEPAGAVESEVGRKDVDSGAVTGEPDDAPDPEPDASVAPAAGQGPSSGPSPVEREAAPRADRPDPALSADRGEGGPPPGEARPETPAEPAGVDPPLDGSDAADEPPQRREGPVPVPAVDPSPGPAPSARDVVEAREADVLRAAGAAGAAHRLERRIDTDASGGPDDVVDGTDEDGPAPAGAPHDEPHGPPAAAVTASPVPEYLRRPSGVPQLVGRPPGTRESSGTAGRPAAERSEASAGSERTDEIPRAARAPERQGVADVAPEEFEADGGDVETTAQLAILLDEIEARPERP